MLIPTFGRVAAIDLAVFEQALAKLIIEEGGDNNAGADIKPNIGVLNKECETKACGHTNCAGSKYGFFSRFHFLSSRDVSQERST